MVQITIGPNTWVTCPFVGVDNNGTPRLIHGTATIDDYNKAYVALIDGNSSIAVVPKQAAAQGASFVVTATLHAQDANGNDLPMQQLQVTVDGDTPTPLAVQVNFGPAAAQSPIDTVHATPSDPGAPVVSF